jgi:hypothetical protein
VIKRSSWRHLIRALAVPALAFGVVGAALALSAPLAARRLDVGQAKDAAAEPDVMWRDPGNVAALNVFYGAGGQAHAPNPKGTFTFVKEDLRNTTPKFDVKDAQGVQWRIKLAEETHAETASTRLLWAAGYFADEDYYLAELKVAGMPKLSRGGEFVSADGTVRGARLKRQLPDMKKLGTWDWVDNPFHNTRELHGLAVMMSLLNNWDVSTINNAIYDTGRERRYIVTDIGASFGNAGDRATETKSVPKDYERSTFVERTAPDSVDFTLHSRLFMQSAVKLSYYQELVRSNEATKHIPRADAKWLGQRLSLLSVEQIRDAFRAAGYTHEEIELCTRVVRKRIAELLAL